MRVTGTAWPRVIENHRGPFRFASGMLVVALGARQLHRSLKERSRSLPDVGPVSVRVAYARFVGLTAGARTIVTGRRAGHTCVVSATHVPLATLLRLAEWRYDASPA